MQKFGVFFAFRAIHTGLFRGIRKSDSAGFSCPVLPECTASDLCFPHRFRFT